MKKISINILAALLLMLLPEVRAGAAPDDGDKTSKPAFVTTNANMLDITYDDATKVYTFTTSGNDPYVFTELLGEALPVDSSVISFEYICTSGIPNLQIFFLQPLSEANSLKNISLPATEEGEWTTFQLDISTFRYQHDWGKAENFMRFDFGSQPNVTIQLRRLHIGAPKKEEEEPWADYRDALKSVIDSISDLRYDFRAGTAPGYISYEDSVNYATTYNRIAALAENSAATQEELKAAVAELRDLILFTVDDIIPLPDGNYFITSAYPAFGQQQATATYAILQQKGTDNVRWAQLDSAQTGSYFNISRLSNDRYLIQNLKDFRFIGGTIGVAGASTHAYVNYTTDRVEQILTPSGNGSYYISSMYNKTGYLSAIGSNNGDGTGGTVEPIGSKDDTELWAFVPADTVHFAEYRNTSVQEARAELLADSLTDARAKSLSVKSPEGLIKEAAQLSSNCVWQQNLDVDKLLDGNHNSYFHSTTSMSIFNDDEWLQADLGRDDVSQFVLEFWGRNDGAGRNRKWHDTPNDIVIEASNTPDDDASWSEIVHLDKGFPADIDNGHFVSATVNMKANYRYIRMHVKGTTSKTPYWNISEFQLYEAPITPSANSLYSKAADAKDATDELDAAIASAEEHISNLSIDGSEMATINGAIAVITEIENSIDRVQEIVNSASDLYRSLFVLDASPQGLITEVNTKNDGTNQLWSNCTWMGINEKNDNYSFNEAFIKDGYNLLGTLIDNNDQTYWHSDPSFNVNSQNGFFQIDLKRDGVSSYVIMLYRRNDLYNGVNRHGQVPTEAEVYATNDESVGTDLESDNSAWTQIASIDGIPNEATTQWPYYTSALGNGTAYRYLRVHLYNSSQVYFGLSGFNVYNASDMYDHAASQYYSVDGMKDAADKMMALADAVQAKIDSKEVTIADGQELQTDIEAVQALWQDRDGLESLSAKAQNLLGNVNEGNEMGQLPDMSKTAALEDAVVAAENIPSSTSEFNNLRKNLQDAYDAVLDAIVQPVPGKWYYILSATAADDSTSVDNYYGVAARQVKGAALYVLSNGGARGRGDVEGEYNISQLRWGMDDVKGKPREGDVDALWRFVAAPDSFGKRTYYIQNLRTGWYVGSCFNGDYYYNQQETADVPYRVEFIGQDQFNLVPLAGVRAGIPISFGNNARQVRGDNIQQAPGNRAAFTFEEFSIDENPEINIDFYNDSARIVTLPFAVEDISLTDGVKAYGIHSVVRENGSGIGIGLKEKTSFAAGEPFILVVGDTSKHTAESGFKSLAFTTPEASEMLQVLRPDTVNGLVGTFPRITVRARRDKDYLYLNSKLYVNSRENAANGVVAYAHTGYIDPDLIETQEGEPDEVIYAVNGSFRAEIVNTISRIAGKDNGGNVNVYTIDGAAVKLNVKPADALKGLRKGIYIIGKKKVQVR